MRIDYDRLIILLLPLRIRTVRLISLLRVLVSPIVIMHDNFHIWSEKRRIRAAATPQALMVEQLVLSETGLSIKIIPVEIGASPDFEVKHPDDASAANVEAARSVIDRYKLAGKSYRVVGSVVPFTASWSGFICVVSEIIAVESQEWTEPVCQVIAETLPVNQIRVIQVSAIIKLIALYPVTSTISCVIIFPHPDDYRNESFTIQIGESESGSISYIPQLQSCSVLSGPTPATDENYEYQILTI